MNEEKNWSRSSEKSEAEDLDSTSSKGKKINEYRSTGKSFPKVPKTKMGATDVLGLVYERLDKAAEKVDVNSRRVESAALKFEQASKRIPDQIVSQVGGSLSEEVKKIHSSTSDSLDSFKTWCEKWMMWFVGVSCCAVCLLILSMYMGVRLYQSNSQIERLEYKCDSIHDREEVFEGFVSKYPGAFRKWLDEQTQPKSINRQKGK